MFFFVVLLFSVFLWKFSFLDSKLICFSAEKCLIYIFILLLVHTFFPQWCWWWWCFCMTRKNYSQDGTFSVFCATRKLYFCFFFLVLMFNSRGFVIFCWYCWWWIFLLLCEIRFFLCTRCVSSIDWDCMILRFVEC